MHQFYTLTCLALASILLVGCTQEPVKVTQNNGLNLKKVRFDELQGFDEERNIQVAAYRFKEVCKKLYNHPKRFTKIYQENKKTWFDKCSKLSAASSYKELFSNNFTPYAVTFNNNSKGLFTGYFEKEINGSLRKTNRFKYPLYKKPGDTKLLKLTREQINNGALKSKGLEVAYTDNLPDLFMLQVQGSGVLRLDHGKKIKIAFGGKNEHKYSSLGKYFGEKKLLPSNKINSTSIFNYLKKNPKTANKIMNINDSYVFFNLSSGGPYGSLGTSLKPEVSIAVDRNFIPLGSLLWLETPLPNGKKLNHLVIAEDTGSAIKGAVRGDIFFGSGKKAEYLASNMTGRGRYYILLPNEINPDSYF